MLILLLTPLDIFFPLSVPNVFVTQYSTNYSFAQLNTLFISMFCITVLVLKLSKEIFDAIKAVKLSFSGVADMAVPQQYVGVDSYFDQLFGNFKPELCLVFILLSLLVALAVELRRGRSRTVLSIESLQVVTFGVALTVILYTVQLIVGQPTLLVLNDYMYVAPGLTAAKLLVTLAALFVLLSSEQYVREQRRHTLEFAIMLASALLMLLVLINANKLIVTFLTVGGFSLCLYILILFDIVAKASREAALKYFYLSTLSTGLILFGSFLFYVANKETQFGELLTLLVYTPTADALVLSQAAIVFVLTGLFFKLSAFPAHLWAVDVYEGSPAPVMAFFILPVKIAVFFALIRILNTAFVGYENIWLPCLSLAAVGSLAWGAFAAAQERKITRFLGYASINQLGFLLLAAATTTDKATNAIVLYLVLYALMTGGFLLAFIHARRYDNHNLIYISDLRGFAKLERLLSWNVATALFSMAGVPPLGGFFGKYLIIDAALCGGLYAQVVVALATSVISTFYYLQIIKAFWFEETPATNPVRFFLSSLQRNLLSGKAALLWIGPVFIPLIITAPAPVVTALTSSSGLSAAIF